MVAGREPARIHPARRRHLRDAGAGRSAAACLDIKGRYQRRSRMVAGRSLPRFHRGRARSVCGSGRRRRGPPAYQTGSRRRYLTRSVAGWRHAGVRAAHQHFQLGRIRYAAQSRRNYGRCGETDYVRSVGHQYSGLDCRRAGDPVRGFGRAAETIRSGASRAMAASPRVFPLRPWFPHSRAWRGNPAA